MESAEQSVTVWVELVRARERAVRHVEAVLKAHGLPPLIWYDVLWEVEKAAPDGMRPMELIPRLLLAQYAVSRLVDRLVQEGLIDRTRSPEDGRGQRLILTDAGRDMRKRMWRVYRPAITAAIGTALDPGEKAELARLLSRVGDAGA